jgi:putative flippase GtrA
LVTLTGFATSLLRLSVLVDRLGMPHQLAQLLALAAIVPTMFVLLRHMVFRPAGRAS